MLPTQHPSNNGVLGAPTSWDQSATPCSALAITRTEVDGHQVIASFWRPDSVELAMLQAGKPVVLFVYGSTHPVVSMGVAA